MKSQLSNTHSRLLDTSSISTSTVSFPSLLDGNNSNSLMKDISFEWIPPSVNQAVSTKDPTPSPIKDNSMTRELFQEPSIAIVEEDNVAVEEPLKQSFSQFPPLRSFPPLSTISQHAPAQKPPKSQHRIDWSVVNSSKFSAIRTTGSLPPAAPPSHSLPLSQAMNQFSQTITPHRLPTQGTKRLDAQQPSATKVWRAALDESTRQMPDTVTSFSQGELTRLLKECILQREYFCCVVEDEKEFEMATVVECDQRDTIRRLLLFFHQGERAQKLCVLLGSCYVIQQTLIHAGSVVGVECGLHG